MKFAYVAAALLGFAYGSPAFSEAPETDSLALHEVREVEDVALLDERDEAIALFESMDEMFTMLEEREAEAEADFDDEFEEEMTELEARSTGSILSALKKVNSNVKKVKSALDKIPKNKKAPASKALKVRQAAAKLSSAVQAATGAANGSGKINKAGSKKIFGYVQKTLKPATIKSLNDFIAHKAAFKKGGFSGVVKSNLQQLQGQVSSLANALISKAGSKKIKKQGKKVASQINAAFNKAIAAY